MRTPSSALPAWPNGLVEGFGAPLPLDLAASFTIFFALGAAFFATFFAVFLAGFAAFFCFLAIGVSLYVFPSAHSRVSGNPVLGSGSLLLRGRAARELFLLQLAPRIEIADAARLAAGSRIENRIDQRRLARVHCGVDGTFEFVGRGRVDADAAERLD